MSKDPAFLFYPNDWLGGTMFLSRHQKGCYIDLLIAQFNNGPLSSDSIKTILGQDQAVWTVLLSKFKQTADGLWYNEKLATEIERRKKFSESRRENINKRYKKATSVDTSVVHMNIHMETEARTINNTLLDKNNKEGNSEKKIKPDFPQMPSELDIGLELPEIKTGACIQLLKISGKGDVLPEQVLSIWQVFKIQNFTGKKFYNSKSDVYSHFINWIKTQKFEIPPVKKSLYDHEKILERQRAKLADR